MWFSTTKSMGDLDVRLITSQKEHNSFTSSLLRDLKALEQMLDTGVFPFP